MKKTLITLFIIAIILSSCGKATKKKRSLDDTLFKYAAVIRWSNYDAAVRFLYPNRTEIRPTEFELSHLKQFKVSKYDALPITPGNKSNIITQDVSIQIYNIHSNKTRTIQDHQVWEYDNDANQWYLTSGLPKL